MARLTVHLNAFERTFLGVGSALASLLDPSRGDMVAVFSELSAGPFLGRLRDQMLAAPDGRRLLRERPRLRSDTIPLAELAKMGDGTLGREYVRWLDWCKVSPDTREPVRYIDDPELAYVMQRYRECHDFYHLISGPFPVSMAPEVVVKLFEFANMGLPVALLSSVFGPLRLASDERKALFDAYLGWALRAGSAAKPLINVEWEKHWTTDIDRLRDDIGIVRPPVEWRQWRRDLRASRATAEA